MKHLFLNFGLLVALIFVTPNVFAQNISDIDTDLLTSVIETRINESVTSLKISRTYNPELLIAQFVPTVGNFFLGKMSVRVIDFQTESSGSNSCYLFLYPDHKSIVIQNCENNQSKTIPLLRINWEDVVETN